MTFSLPSINYKYIPRNTRLLDKFRKRLHRRWAHELTSSRIGTNGHQEWGSIGCCQSLSIPSYNSSLYNRFSLIYKSDIIDFVILFGSKDQRIFALLSGYKCKNIRQEVHQPCPVVRLFGTVLHESVIGMAWWPGGIHLDHCPDVSLLSADRA